MKKLIYFLAISFAIIGCLNDKETEIVDDNSDCIIGQHDIDITSNTILGKWKLMRSRTLAWDNNNIDLSEENIIYDFQSNGILVITGSINLSGYYPEGDYNFVFEKDYLGYQPNPDVSKTWLLKVEGEIWTHDSQNNLMVLGQSYVDGSDLCFERKIE